MTGLADPLPPRLTAGFTAMERARFRRAYEFAARRHAGQTRRSGDPYVTHLVAVAEIAVDVGMDCDAVCAALLHDVIEKGGCDRARVRAEFGDEVAALVQGMTELDHGVLAAADDRVLTLKVLDRLHNMRTIAPLDQAKRELKSRQTLDVVAPLADHLGLPAVADELASIARRHLPADPLHRVLAVGSLLLPAASRQGYLDEWLGELDVSGDRRARVRFVLGLIHGMPALALALRRPTGRAAPLRRAVPLRRAAPLCRALTVRLLTALRWVLRSDLRTWAPLALLVGWMTLEAARSSLGDAVTVLITVPPVLHAGVTRLRRALR